MILTGNEPANPLSHDYKFNTSATVHYGLTIRQHFAAMAMQGALATCSPNHYAPLHIAEMSVKIADALIAELNKNL
jgi:hypothetical protein